MYAPLDMTLYEPPYGCEPLCDAEAELRITEVPTPSRNRVRPCTMRLSDQGARPATGGGEAWGAWGARQSELFFRCILHPIVPDLPTYLSRSRICLGKQIPLPRLMLQNPQARHTSRLKTIGFPTLTQTGTTNPDTHRAWRYYSMAV